MLRVLPTLVILGVVIYLVVRLIQRRGDGGGGGGRTRRPIAPDDDPGFLRDLDDQLWQDQQRKVDPDQGTADT